MYSQEAVPPQHSVRWIPISSRSIRGDKRLYQPWLLRYSRP